MNLHDLLLEAAQNEATDLYIIPGAVPCMTCAGTFVAPHAALGQRLMPEHVEDFARSLMSDRQWQEFLELREANLAYMDETAGRFRINAMWQRGSIGLVFRRVVMQIPTLRELGLPPVLREIALANRGIVLVTGATGCGKSTTMASMLDYRCRLRTGHIVTIEDPIEFLYRHHRSIVSQREVGIDTESFEEALRNSLRQAPNVISIGELRDSDTVQFALHAAETGHLVFATLHSTSAPLAIDRLLNFYPGELHEQVLSQISNNLLAIVCQRLIPTRAGGQCCACEILRTTPRVHDLIQQGDLGTIRETLNAENDEGIQSFDKALYHLVKREVVEASEALSAAESSNDLRLKLQGFGVTGASWEDIRDPWNRIAEDYALPEGHAPDGRDALAAEPYDNDRARGIAAPPAARPAPGPASSAAGGSGSWPRQASGVGRGPRDVGIIPTGEFSIYEEDLIAPGDQGGGAGGGDERPGLRRSSGPSSVAERFRDVIDGMTENLDEGGLDETRS